MDKALAIKWIYSYANNNEVLWRKVICDRSGDNSNSLMPVLGNKGNKSILLRFVEVMIGRNEQASEVIN